MLKKYEHQIYHCTRCGFCRVWGWKGVDYVCPTYPHTKAWETEYARGRVRLARLGDVIMQCAPELVGGYRMREAHTLRVTRDTDISVDEGSTESLLTSIEQELRSRRRSSG